jgi:hypothetical protein
MLKPLAHPNLEQTMNWTFRRLRRDIQRAYAADGFSDRVLAITIVLCMIGIFVAVKIAEVYGPGPATFVGD